METTIQVSTDLRKELQNRKLRSKESYEDVKNIVGAKDIEKLPLGAIGIYSYADKRKVGLQQMGRQFSTLSARVSAFTF